MTVLDGGLKDKFRSSGKLRRISGLAKVPHVQLQTALGYLLLGLSHCRGSKGIYRQYGKTVNKGRTSVGADEPFRTIFSVNRDLILGKHAGILQITARSVAGIRIGPPDDLIADAPVRLLLPLELCDLIFLIVNLCGGSQSHLLNDRIAVNTGGHTAETSEGCVPQTAAAVGA